MKIALKYYAQYDKFSCGCICVKMLLERFGIKVARDKIIKEMGAQPLIGVEKEDIIEYLQRYGLEIIEKEETTIDELKNYLLSGYPIIVNYISPLSHYGHFGIITGFSENEEILYFADPRSGQDFGIAFSNFEAIWRNRPENDVQVSRWSLIAGRERIILDKDI